MRWLAVLLGSLLLGAPAAAVSAFDDRVEVHGYYEAQIRSIVRDFDFSDNWDLTQWWNILALEIEANVAPEGFGPFDIISIFARVEVRYDCVWTGACTIFDSANAYRFSSYGKLPGRLSDGHRTGYAGTNYQDDTRHYRQDIPYNQVPNAPDDRRLRPDSESSPTQAYQTSQWKGFFGGSSYGFDGIPHFADDNQTVISNDDPPWTFWSDLLTGNCNRWSSRNRRGSQNGLSAGETLPLNPNCNFEQIGAVANVPNPFNSKDFNPLINSFGSAALPYRPAPVYRADVNAPIAAGARGNYYPNYRLQQMLDDGSFDTITTKYREGEIAWNRGQSQQEQKELKELYVDLEMFDSRLWIRAGYQTIVWGKTELFRNQDQFNPQDVGLASLPSLEESRISLWAVRGIWSFYDVGPLNDVRLELAMNFDQYQSIDPGICGEPYAPLVICPLSVGLMAHGYLGLGLAGADFPEDPWNDISGIEVGARLEFRLDRFSFAITDFYGYQDTPYVDTLFLYSRNVDPTSGRPRHTMTDGPCKTGKESACLDSENALTQHSANQQLFSAICFNTLAVAPSLDPTACLANIFGSPARSGANPATSPEPLVIVALNTVGQGDLGPTGQVLSGLAEFPADGSVQDAIQAHSYNGELRKATVNLNVDPNDGGVDYSYDYNDLQARDDFGLTVDIFYSTFGTSLSAKLTDQQEATLGCGKFFKSSCDLDGMDFLNMEAGVLFQSWTHVSGTFTGDANFHWNTTDNSRAQPGTVGFKGAPLCSRYEGGKMYVLPGCRGPGDKGYNPKVDGTVTGLLQPFTGQQFQNELAALSWNFLMGLVGFSLPPRPFGQPDAPRGAPRSQDFDAANPFRTGACSFAEPQWCSNVSAIADLAGTRRNDMLAGGNGAFGRRDFVYHSGGAGVLRVDKSNVLGLSMDFAEDVTKSNWGVEFTWVEGLHVGDNDELDGLADGVDLYRLTISVDRPTFVNFLNANRTFFVNTQWFVQYMNPYKSSYSGGYDWDIFGVLAISTGYFQDRLLPSLTMVYFVRSSSAAVLPQVTYRFTENFQASFGLALFSGREVPRDMPLAGLAPASERFGRNAYNSYFEPGLSLVRERDEIFLRLRYTF